MALSKRGYKSLNWGVLVAQDPLSRVQDSSGRPSWGGVDSARELRIIRV